MKIILIGNYPPDKQESMIRFAQMLQNGFQDAGVEALTWKPVVFFGSSAKSTIAGIGKWLGYIDKWFLFPLVLLFKLRKKRLQKEDVFFHICDHSNSPYLKYLPKKKTVVTCHDVLAIRGALGYEDAFCTSTGMGKILQKWILRHLASSNKIACVSNLTLQQLQQIVPPGASNGKDWIVIHNSFNAHFEAIAPAKAMETLQKAGLIQSNYILHVGSSLPRKNRKILLEMVDLLGSKYQGKICFAGEAIDESLMEQVIKLNLKDRVISIEKPDHPTLNALYSACDAFVFPSFSEGFGWPVIEAQASGTPVIASDSPPMPEVSGGAAIHVNSTRPAAFADAFLSLSDLNKRSSLIEAGFKNTRRFSINEIISSYIKLHTTSHVS